MKTFMELAKERYSCRKISDRPVPRELVERVLETAATAPTAVNKQMFRLWVPESQQAKDRIRQVTNYTFGADHFILVGAKEEDNWTRPFDGYSFSDVDAAIVAAHIMLEIQDLGLATTWVGHFDAPQLQELYPQMKGYRLIALFPFGYPAEDAQPGPAHSQRKSVQELTEVL